MNLALRLAAFWRMSEKRIRVGVATVVALALASALAGCGDSSSPRSRVPSASTQREFLAALNSADATIQASAGVATRCSPGGNACMSSAYAPSGRAMAALQTTLQRIAAVVPHTDCAQAASAAADAMPAAARTWSAGALGSAVITNEGARLDLAYASCTRPPVFYLSGFPNDLSGP